MLLRQSKSYGLPDLLAYKINKATATACKSVSVCHNVHPLCYILLFYHNCIAYLTMLPCLKSILHFFDNADEIQVSSEIFE